MNKIVHLGLFLAIVSAVAGGALAFANQMTAPVIAANNEKQEKESLLAMYPDANAMILNWSMQHWILKRFKRFMNIKTFISST